MIGGLGFENFLNGFGGFRVVRRDFDIGQIRVEEKGSLRHLNCSAQFDFFQSFRKMESRSNELKRFVQTAECGEGIDGLKRCPNFGVEQGGWILRASFEQNVASMVDTDPSECVRVKGEYFFEGRELCLNKGAGFVDFCFNGFEKSFDLRALMAG